MNNRITGSFESTGQAMSVTKVGFLPVTVKLYNATKSATFSWNNAMPDDTGMLAAAVGGWQAATAHGVTPLVTGFTLGANTAVHASGDVIYYEVTG